MIDARHFNLPMTLEHLKSPEAARKAASDWRYIAMSIIEAGHTTRNVVDLLVDADALERIAKELEQDDEIGMPPSTSLEGLVLMAEVIKDASETQGMTSEVDMELLAGMARTLHSCLESYAARGATGS